MMLESFVSLFVSNPNNCLCKVEGLPSIVEIARLKSIHTVYNVYFVLVCYEQVNYTAIQSQKAVTACFLNEPLLQFDFATRHYF